MNRNLQDSFLVASALAGDEEAFGKLYDRYIDEIFRFVLVRVRNVPEAEDLSSEVFLKVWQYLTTSERKIENFKAFIFRIARNLIIDHYRQPHAAFVGIEDDQAQSVPDARLDVSASFQLQDEVRQMLVAVETLPEPEQELLVMRYIDDLSISEIAVITDKSNGAIRVALHRAVKQLKRKLAEK